VRDKFQYHIFPGTEQFVIQVSFMNTSRCLKRVLDQTFFGPRLVLNIFFGYSKVHK
jgi:hypothetical protein